jgi:hypothetical protein
MNRAIDTAAAHQCPVGGIDDGVHSFFGDVANRDNHSAAQE